MAKRTVSEPSQVVQLHSMKTEHLVEEARLQSTGISSNRDHIESLRAILDFVLSSHDYNEDKQSAPAMVSRCLAAVIVNMENEAKVPKVVTDEELRGMQVPYKDGRTISLSAAAHAANEYIGSAIKFQGAIAFLVDALEDRKSDLDEYLMKGLATVLYAISSQIGDIQVNSYALRGSLEKLSEGYNEGILY